MQRVCVPWLAQAMGTFDSSLHNVGHKLQAAVSTTRGSHFIFTVNYALTVHLIMVMSMDSYVVDDSGIVRHMEIKSKCLINAEFGDI